LEDQSDVSRFGFVGYAENPEFRRAVHAGSSSYAYFNTDVFNIMHAEFMDSKHAYIEDHRNKVDDHPQPD